MPANRKRASLFASVATVVLAAATWGAGCGGSLAVESGAQGEDGGVDGTTLGAGGDDGNEDACIGCGADGAKVSSCADGTCTGCCDSTGRCLAGSASGACGSKGAACVTCNATQACADGKCAPGCNATTCAGCCSDGGCSSGATTSTCGYAGQACTDCAPLGLACVPTIGADGGGVCGSLDAGTEPDGATACGPTNCSGCCAGNICLPGTSADDCGSHGQACTLCTGSTLTCAPQASGGGCVGSGSSGSGSSSGGSGSGSGGSSGCSPSNCAGCCDANGQCQDPSAIGACGTGGFACEFCLPQQACNSGQCQTTTGCGPTNCLGCCQNGVCLGGTDATACGTEGAACTSCQTCRPLAAKAGGVCSNDGSCGCPVGECFDAYCICHPGNSSDFCTGPHDGGSDNQCGTCGGDCSSGLCQGPACSIWNCSGCCQTDGTCWMGGRDDDHCGGDGSLCVNCGPGYVCTNASVLGSICSIACSPENCQGCCADQVCVPGNDPTACATGGNACVQCASGQSCINGSCLTLTQCGSTLCGGCCANDVCLPGSESAACGTGGDACQNCTSTGETCKGATCVP